MPTNSTIKMQPEILVLLIIFIIISILKENKNYINRINFRNCFQNQ